MNIKGKISIIFLYLMIILIGIYQALLEKRIEIIIINSFSIAIAIILIHDIIFPENEIIKDWWFQ